jgi:hypothetical protein
MPVETTAQASALSGTPDEDDYQAFCQTLSASERGRAFLAEYARRNRNADTEQLLAAIEQLRSVMVAQPAPQRTDLVKRQLRELLDEIGTAQCELDELLLATKTEALANARVESRISRILWSLRADAASEVETSPPASEAPAEPAEESERTHLAVVPVPDQPELPIPSPGASSPPTISLVRTETELAEVAFIEAPPEQDVARSDQPVSGEGKPVDTNPPAAGPLPSIMSWSEDERLALFT